MALASLIEFLQGKYSLWKPIETASTVITTSVKVINLSQLKQLGKYKGWTGNRRVLGVASFRERERGFKQPVNSRERRSVMCSIGRHCLRSFGISAK